MPPHRMGGAPIPNHEAPHRMGGHGNAQRAHERDDTGGKGRHRRPKDGRQRSGADAGAQPPRPPAPATPQTPTVDRDATDARQAVHRQGSPRSPERARQIVTLERAPPSRRKGPPPRPRSSVSTERRRPTDDRHALHPAGRAPAGFFGFVKPAGPAAGGRDVFVLGSAVEPPPDRWPALIDAITAAGRLAAELRARNAHVKLREALNEARGGARRSLSRRPWAVSRQRPPARHRAPWPGSRPHGPAVARAGGSSRCRKPRCGWPRPRWRTATRRCPHCVGELGIRPVTLYRYVGPQDQLREQGQEGPRLLNRRTVTRVGLSVGSRPLPQTTRGCHATYVRKDQDQDQDQNTDHARERATTTTATTTKKAVRTDGDSTGRDPGPSCAPETPPPARRTPGKDKPATPRQLEYVAYLADELGIPQPNLLTLTKRSAHREIRDLALRLARLQGRELAAARAEARQSHSEEAVDWARTLESGTRPRPCATAAARSTGPNPGACAAGAASKCEALSLQRPTQIQRPTIPAPRPLLRAPTPPLPDRNVLEPLHQLRVRELSRRGPLRAQGHSLGRRRRLAASPRGRSSRRRGGDHSIRRARPNRLKRPFSGRRGPDVSSPGNQPPITLQFTRAEEGGSFAVRCNPGRTLNQRRRHPSIPGKDCKTAGVEDVGFLQGLGSGRAVSVA